MKASQAGFSLIELMIVVAVIGILAAIASPLYTHYVIKSQTNRAVAELSVYRSTVEVILSSSGDLTNDDIGYTASSLVDSVGSDDIAEFNSDGSGHLEVTLGGDAHSILHGLVLMMARTSEGVWSCVIDTSAVSGWDDSYLPTGCEAS